MALDDEISNQAKQLSTDAYAMSIGELINLYKDRELTIRPEFQRFFRWTGEQKSRLIESLLLGIPIPPIFVSQDEKGKWDVIDGLQRLSTIFQLVGELRGEDDQKAEPLTLSKTKYLPSLKDKKWQCDDENDPSQLSELAKLSIKRARLDIKIVLNKSDKSSKYELFDRLNTGGSAATDQEVRNCILIMLNKPFYNWLSNLGKDENFRACIPLTERQLQEQYDLELVVRFLTLRNATQDDLSSMLDIGPFLTDKITLFAENSSYDLTMEEEAFRRTFQVLADSLGEDSFKKFSTEKAKYTGASLISIFEVLALGVGHNCLNPSFALRSEKLMEIQRSIPSMEEFVGSTGSGVRATTRLIITVPLGRKLFAL